MLQRGVFGVGGVHHQFRQVDSRRLRMFAYRFHNGLVCLGDHFRTARMSRFSVAILGRFPIVRVSVRVFLSGHGRASLLGFAGTRAHDSASSPTSYTLRGVA